MTAISTAVRLQTNQALINATETSSNSFFLPDEAIAHIFTRMTRIHDYSSFARTSKQIHKIAYSIPIYALDPHVYQHVLVRHLKLNQAATKLIRTTGRLSFIGTEDARYEVRLMLKQHNEAEFYKLFKKCCFKQGSDISCKSLAAYGEIIIHHLENRSKILGSIDIVSTKIALGLSKKLYSDMIDLYATLDTESITIESFKLKVCEIKDIFKDCSLVAIETSVRQALILRHQKHFEVFSDNCMNSISSSQIFQRIKSQLLAAKKAVIEKELDGLQKTIYRAHKKMKELEYELEIACKEQSEATSSFGCITLMNFLFISEEFGEVRAIEYELKKTMNVRTKLLKRQNEIALRDGNGNIIGSQLTQADAYEIATNTRQTLRQNSLFYAELCASVTDENKEERYLAMRGIIGD